MDGETGKEALTFNGKKIEFNAYFIPLVFSQDGTKIAWTEDSWVGGEPRIYHPGKLYIASTSSMNKAKQMDFLLSPPNFIRWWPDSSKILVFDRFAVSQQETWNIDTNSDLFGLYTVSVPSLSVSNEHRSDVLDVLVPENCSAGRIKDEFSPDGRQILAFWKNDECDLITGILDLETMTFSEILYGLSTTNAYWLP